MKKAKNMTRPYIRRDWDDNVIDRYRMKQLKSVARKPDSDADFMCRLYDKIIMYFGIPHKRHLAKRMHSQRKKRYLLNHANRPKLKGYRPFYGMID